MDPADTTGYTSPFQTPVFTVPTANFSSLLTILFLLIFLGWVIYTLVATYHWFRYSHRSWLAVPAIATHIVISGLLIFYIASGV